MDKELLKQQFLAKFPQELIGKIPAIHHRIIDDGIEQILNGTSSIEGRMPETEQEWYVLLGTHFVYASTALNGVIQGTREAYAKEPLNINVNYRGETHTFEFDALEG